MSSQAPTVSICIPVYNGAKFIRQTLGSVFAQTFEDFEVLISDNASTDDTVSIIQEFNDPRIRLIRQETNLGAEGNWNFVVTNARGAYIKLLCADDLVYPHCLEIQVAILRDPAHSDVVLVGAKRDIIDEKGKMTVSDWGLPSMSGKYSGQEVMRRIVRSGTNPIGEPSSTLFRGDVLSKGCRFDVSLPYMIDVDFYCKILNHGGFYAIPETLAAFRVSTGSWSGSIGWKQASQARAFFARLKKQHHEVIQGADYVMGISKTVVYGCLRQAVYLWLAARR